MLFAASAAINLVVAGIIIYRCRTKPRETTGKPHDENGIEQSLINMTSRRSHLTESQPGSLTESQPENKSQHGRLTELKPDSGGYEFVDIRSEAADHTARPDDDQQHTGEMYTQLHRQLEVTPDNGTYEDMQLQVSCSYFKLHVVCEFYDE